MTPISEMLALPPGSAVKAEHTLGFLTMFTVPDRMVSHRQAVQLWVAEGLDADTMPKESRPIDLFQQACGAVSTRARRQDRDVMILAERAVLNADECVYQITRSVRDKANKLIEHPKGMSVAYNVARDEITVIQREDYDLINGLEEQIRRNFHQFRGKVPGQKIRNAVRTMIIRQLGGTDYFGKGAYLVPRGELRTLESLRRVLDGLFGEDARITLIPMLATKGNRDDLAYFHTEDMEGRVGGLMETVAERLQRKGEGAVRTDQLANVLAERAFLGDQRKRIVELIGRKTERVDNALTQLDEQIERLMELAAERKGR